MTPKFLVSGIIVLIIISASVFIVPQTDIDIDVIDKVFDTTPSPTITITATNSKYTATNSENTVIASDTNAAKVINSALSTLDPGRTTKERVHLKGNFILSSAIKLPSYTVLSLDGKITRGANDYMVYASGVSHVDIIGGEWNGNLATYSQSSIDGIVFYNSHYVTIGGTSDTDQLNIYGTAYHPINCFKSDHVTIRYVEAHNNGNWNNDNYRAPGIMMYACSNSIVENCYVHDTSKGGIYFYTEDDSVSETIKNNIVQNNRVERTWCSGIEVGNRGTNDVCTGNIVRGNTVIDGGMDGEHAGIAIGWWGPYSGGVRYADHCIVQDNTVYETGKYNCGGGIALMTHDSTCLNNVVHDVPIAIGCRGDRNTISGNDIDRVTVSGIQFWDGSNNEVTKNIISSCGMGITMYKELTSGCSYNHIANNRIEYATEYVVMINEYGDTGNIIENNMFVGKGTISNLGSSTVIRNNTVT